MDFQDRDVLILGLGREGLSLARFLSGRGARVTVTDLATPEKLGNRLKELHGGAAHLVLGGHHPELVEEAEVVFVSPGVPEDNPVYAAARKAHLPIASMTTLFFDLCPGSIVGVTGSSGKTTTAGLIHRILQAAARDTVLAGNIGRPMLDMLASIRPNTIVVLELSSFQLSILRESPHVAVVTNLSPNHLDRHGSMESYIAAKRNIVQHQSPHDYAVLNAADSQVRSFAEATAAELRWFSFEPSFAAGAAVQDDQIGLVRPSGFVSVLPIPEIPLLGRHNVENILAALAAADILGVAKEAMTDAVKSYRPAPHRLEVVAELAGVRYVDDSIATSPARASVALGALDGAVLLIAGGRDKALPWDDFARLVVRKAKALFLLGEAAVLIKQAVENQLATRDGLLRKEAIYLCRSLSEAVRQASQIAAPGEVVLLSPGCASYDMFADFEERGETFAREVEALSAA